MSVLSTNVTKMVHPAPASRLAPTPTVRGAQTAQISPHSPDESAIYLQTAKKKKKRKRKRRLHRRPSGSVYISPPCRAILPIGRFISSFDFKAIVIFFFILQFYFILHSISFFYSLPLSAEIRAALRSRRRWGGARSGLQKRRNRAGRSRRGAREGGRRAVGG